MKIFGTLALALLIIVGCEQKPNLTYSQATGCAAEAGWIALRSERFPDVFPNEPERFKKLEYVFQSTAIRLASSAGKTSDDTVRGILSEGATLAIIGEDEQEPPDIRRRIELFATACPEL